MKSYCLITYDLIDMENLFHPTLLYLAKSQSPTQAYQDFLHNEDYNIYEERIKEVICLPMKKNYSNGITCFDHLYYINTGEIIEKKLDGNVNLIINVHIDSWLDLEENYLKVFKQISHLVTYKEKKYLSLFVPLDAIKNINAFNLRSINKKYIRRLSPGFLMRLLIEANFWISQVFVLSDKPV